MLSQVRTLRHSKTNLFVLEAPIAASEVPVVYVPGPLPVRVSPLEAAKTYLGELRVDGPGLYGVPGLAVA